MYGHGSQQQLLHVIRRSVYNIAHCDVHVALLHLHYVCPGIKVVLPVKAHDIPNVCNPSSHEHIVMYMWPYCTCITSVLESRLYFQSKHMTSPMSSHFQPNVSHEYSTEEFSHPTALNYCQRPSLFSTVMKVASIQIQTRVLSAIVFSVQIASQRFSPGIPFEISHDSILQIACQQFSPGIPFEISLDSNLMYQACFSKRISVSLELSCTQNLNVMAPKSPMQRSLLSAEHHMNLSIVEPKRSKV